MNVLPDGPQSVVACKLSYSRGSVSYAYSRCEDGGVERHARTEIDQAGTADHGDAVDERRVVDPRGAGGVSGEGPTCVYDHPDDGVPAGGEGRGAAGEEGGQLSQFSGRRLRGSGGGRAGGRPRPRA